MGFDESRAGGHLIPPEQGGGSYPAQVIREVFGGLYAGRRAPEFVQPPSVIRVQLDGYSLKNTHEATLCTAYTPEEYGLWEYFIRGTEPKEASPFWTMPEPPADMTALRVGDGVRICFTPLKSYVSYLLYRENAAGYAVLLGTFSGEQGPVTYVDDVRGLTGTVQYYVVPSTAAMGARGEALMGPASPRVSVALYALPGYIQAG